MSRHLALVYRSACPAHEENRRESKGIEERPTVLQTKPSHSPIISTCTDSGLAAHAEAISQEALKLIAS